MQHLKKLTPCLWFSGQAEEAVTFYSGIFKNSKVTEIVRYGEAGKEIHRMPPGSVLTIAFELDGHPFTALNGGPKFKFTEAISFQIYCDTQDEIDHYWDKLSAGGEEMSQQCGWLKDRFGVSWQIVPSVLPQMMSTSDGEKYGRVMMAMLGMKKLNIASLERAYAG